MKKITSQSNIFIIVPTAGAILFATSSLFASGTIVGIGAGQVNSPPNPPNYGQGASQNGVNFIDVSAGDNHSLAIKSDGSLLGWGRNLEGQTTCPTGQFVEASAGGFFSIARSANGSLAGW